MLTRMTDEDWETVVQVFRACRSRRGAKGRDERTFLEARHYFSVHNMTWRALPEAFGNWNSIWKRFWRLSRAGVFEAFFDALAAMSRTAHLVQIFDSGDGKDSFHQFTYGRGGGPAAVPGARPGDRSAMAPESGQSRGCSYRNG
jgi:transposase